MEVRDDLLSDNRQWTNADILRERAVAESRGYARGVEASAREVDAVTEITMSQPTRNAAEARTKMEVMALLGALRHGIRALLPAPPSPKETT